MGVGKVLEDKVFGFNGVGMLVNMNRPSLFQCPGDMKNVARITGYPTLVIISLVPAVIYPPGTLIIDEVNLSSE